MSEQNLNISQNSKNQQVNSPYGCPPYIAPRQNPYQIRGAISRIRHDQNEILEQAASRRSFTAVILCIIFGLLFSAIFLRGGFGLSVPLLTAAFYAIALMYIPKKEAKPSKASMALLIPLGLLSAGFLFNDNLIAYFINTLLLITLIPLQLSHMSQKATGAIFSPQSVYHTFICTVLRPLCFLDAPFKSIHKNTVTSKKSTASVMVLLGILFALPVSGVFIALFARADGAFGYFIDRIVSMTNISFTNLKFDIVAGSVIALFISSWFITLKAGKAPRKKEISSVIKLDRILIATFLAILNIVQISFVAVQFGYLFSGMTLPGKMTYAEYARSGFFELCAVLFVSVAVISCCMILSKKDDKGNLPKSVSFLLSLFIACNFVTVASAIYRMLFYINAYDLTVKRFMATWLIVVFAVCMMGAAVKIWFKKFNILGFIAITVMTMSIALNFANINSLIAEYNVNCYIKSLNTSRVRDIDIEYLSVLGPSAAESTYKLYNNCEPKLKPDVKAALDTQKNELEQKIWKNFTIPDIKAAKVFDRVKD